MSFFRRHFALVWWSSPKVCRGAYHLSRRLHVKFRPNQFRFAGVISEKVISYDRTMCAFGTIIIKLNSVHVFFISSFNDQSIVIANAVSQV